MKKILVLGAGLVARPLIKYLLDKKYVLTVADKEVKKAEALVNGYDNGEFSFMDVNDTEGLRDLIKDHFIVVSLLPYTFHLKVAEICLEFKKHMVTTSYVSAEMRTLHNIAKTRDIILLNETGVDPGIDHMSAMKIIDRIHRAGGKVISFESVTGGLPAPESDNNPFGYKFSWSPRGVILAGRNRARFLKEGEIVSIEGKDLFNNYWTDEVKGLGKLEVYPNRDSLLYKEIYELNEAETVFRGTFRNLGWCDKLLNIAKLGYLDTHINENLKNKTMAELTASLINNSGGDVRVKTAAFLDLDTDSKIISDFQWLGLFDNVTVESEYSTYLDKLAGLMLKKMPYLEGEIDMIVMKHRFVAQYGNGSKKEIISTMINKGIAGGDSSMSRTVSLPTAIATEMIVNGVIDLRGVRIPIVPEIYEPILNQLKSMDIGFEEEEMNL